MSKNPQHLIRQNLLPAMPAPSQYRGVIGWLKANLFANPLDSFISIVLIMFLMSAAIPFFDWTLISAVWSGEDRAACTTISQGGVQADNWSGACWAFIDANFGQIMFGSYTEGERWRIALVAVMALIVNIPLLMPSVKHKFLNAAISIFIVPIVGFILLEGGVFGLKFVPTDLWGGLMVTLVIAYTSIAISLPLGTLLALGRRSQITVVKTLSVFFIEIIRGIPLVAILFIASVMFPIFLPKGMSFDKFLRALIGIALFTSVYIAEVIRGGLQAVPQSQYEAAHSLGFKYWGTMILIVLPQAFKIVIPGIINTLIGMFKETSLVYVVSMFDLLGKVQQLSQQAKWVTPQTPKTGYIFAGLIFWVFCFAMSRYGHYIERRMNGVER